MDEKTYTLVLNEKASSALHVLFGLVTHSDDDDIKGKPVDEVIKGMLYFFHKEGFADAFIDLMKQNSDGIHKCGFCKSPNCEEKHV